MNKKKRIPWNKGKKGLQTAWNKGISNTWYNPKDLALGRGWNKGTHIQTNSGKTHFKKGQTKGEKNVNWKGGRVKHTEGYFRLLLPHHPFSNKDGYYMEHRFVCEKILNRYLKPQETLHHIDFNPANNNPENLYLFPTRGKHIWYHRRLNKGQTTKITESNLLSIL